MSRYDECEFIGKRRRPPRFLDPPSSGPIYSGPGLPWAHSAPLNDVAESEPTWLVTSLSWMADLSDDSLALLYPVPIPGSLAKQTKDPKDSNIVEPCSALLPLFSQTTQRKGVLFQQRIDCVYC